MHRGSPLSSRTMVFNPASGKGSPSASYSQSAEQVALLVPAGDQRAQPCCHLGRVAPAFCRVPLFAHRRPRRERLQVASPIRLDPAIVHCLLWGDGPCARPRPRLVPHPVEPGEYARGVSAVAAGPAGPFEVPDEVLVRVGSAAAGAEGCADGVEGLVDPLLWDAF